MATRAQQPAVEAGPAPSEAPLQAAKDGRTAIVTGVVTDTDGAAIAGARVRLSSTNGYSREQTTSAEGRYSFPAVPPGRYMLRARAEGFGEGTVSGIAVNPGAQEIPALALQPAENVSVDAMTKEQLADVQVHQEEQQRLLGVIPNYFVSYDWHAQPLNARQKWALTAKMTLDPVNHAINFGIAGVEQANNSLPGYGRGAGGYFKRFGAAEGDLFAGNVIGGAILPSLLRQDPRYFYKGTGSVFSRAMYALSSAVICRGDNGRWQPNYSSIGGDVAAGALTNVYYPKSDRHGASLTVRNGLIDAGMDGVENLIQEFVLKHVTTLGHRGAGGSGS